MRMEGILRLTRDMKGHNGPCVQGHVMHIRACVMDHVRQRQGVRTGLVMHVQACTTPVNNGGQVVSCAGTRSVQCRAYMP